MTTNPFTRDNWDITGQMNLGDKADLFAQAAAIRYRRICFFAGPGAGKSTSAFWTMWRLKSLGIQADMSREWIKRWAFAKRPMDRLTDQVIVMGA